VGLSTASGSPPPRGRAPLSLYRQVGKFFLLGGPAACLLGADALSAHVGNTFLRVLKESLLIGGWVAMWRPMQVFLYDWWPLVRRGRIYRSLGNAIVHVSQVKDAAPGETSHA
jgi:hypothetical protein